MSKIKQKINRNKDIGVIFGDGYPKTENNLHFQKKHHFQDAKRFLYLKKELADKVSFKMNLA